VALALVLVDVDLERHGKRFPLVPARWRLSRFRFCVRSDFFLSAANPRAP
jgi:hypothetical protein